MVAKIEMVNRTDSRTAVIRVYLSADRPIEVDAAVERIKLPARDRNDGVRIAAQMTTELQAKLDFRQLLTVLPLDDPDRTVDPRQPGCFWADFDGDTYLVGRETNVTITWTGSKYTIRSRPT